MVKNISVLPKLFALVERFFRDSINIFFLKCYALIFIAFNISLVPMNCHLARDVLGEVRVGVQTVLVNLKVTQIYRDTAASKLLEVTKKSLLSDRRSI